MKEVKKIKYKRSDKERICMPEKLARGDCRTDFERDRARIIHSAAFRRLQGKTQVFTAGEGDFFRTRLTHSLEVAQIAKGLALRFGADTDLVEAISLAHDIGHPPFGHAGEYELKKLMKPYGGFEANAQNIRILTKLESKSEQYEGLNLTRAVIDGQLKYKVAFSRDEQKFVYQEDMKTVEWASDEASAEAGGLKKKWKSFECEIMDWADDIAYAVHDLEDGLHAGYIDRSTFDSDEDPRHIRTCQVAAKKLGCCEEDVSKEYSKLKQLIYKRLYPNRKGRSNETNDRLYHKQNKTKRKELTRFLIDRYVRYTKVDKRPGVSSDACSQRYFYTVRKLDKHRLEVEID